MTPTQSHWEAEYKLLEQQLKAEKYLYSNSTKYITKLRAEIRALQRKLRDANRGAERNAWIAHDLAKELLEYKIKHPEPHAEKIEAGFVTGTSVASSATNYTSIKSIKITKL